MRKKKQEYSSVIFKLRKMQGAEQERGVSSEDSGKC